MMRTCRAGAGIVLAAGSLLVSGPRVLADCVFYGDFTAERGEDPVPCTIVDVHYYNTLPHSLAPEPTGLWDSTTGSNGTTNEIHVVADPAGGGNQVVRFTGGGPAVGNVGTRRTFALQTPCGVDGLFAFSARIKAGTGGGASFWNLTFGSSSGNHGQFQGGADFVNARTGPNTLAPVVRSLSGTGTWDNLAMITDVQSNVTEFFFNGASMGGPIARTGVSIGSVDRFILTRLANAAAAGHTVYLDDVSIQRCRVPCIAKVTPYLTRNVSSTSGPSFVTYSIWNRSEVGSPSVTYTISESDVNGNAVNHPWLNLSTTGVGPLAPGDTGTFNTTFAPTGTPGVYTGYVKVTESCTNCGCGTGGCPASSCGGGSTFTRYYLRRIDYYEGLAASCYADSFTYANGELAPNGGWSNTGGSGAITVDGGAVKMFMGQPGNSASVQATRTLSCPPCVDGKITVIVKARASSTGGGFGWNLSFASTSGDNLAHWNGQPGFVRGRNAGGNTVTESKALSTSGFNELKAVIDTVSKTTTYYFDGVLFATNPVQAHGEEIAYQAGVNDTVGSITFDRIGRSDLSGFVLFDDIQVITCGSCAATILPDQPGRAINYNNFSAAMVGGTPDIFEWDFDVYNNSASPFTINVQEVDASGNPFNHSWINLGWTSRAMAPDQQRERNTVTVNSVGLTPGEYRGFLRFTDTCGGNTYALRELRMIVIAPDTQTASHTCLVDSFSTPGTLTGRVGWSGTASTSINVVNGALRISANPTEPAASVSAVTDVPGFDGGIGGPCVLQTQCQNQSSLISARVKLQAGTAVGGNIWQISFLSDGPIELARFYRTGNRVAGRVDNTATSDAILTPGPGFDEVEARINISETLTIGGIPPNSTQFFFNGVPFPGTNPISHAGAGNTIVQVLVDRTAGTGADFITLDDLRVDYCVPACNNPVFDVRNQVNAVVPDGFVDSHDLEFGFKPCVTGPTPGPGVFEALSFECKCMDVNGDQAIDINDFARFQRCYSGSQQPADPGCDD